VRVTANGTKSWIFRYTSGGRTRDMGLGAFPTVTLGSAREFAIECRRQRQDGRDPIGARASARAAASLEGLRATTFETCAEQLMSSREIGWRNTKHRQEWRRTLLPMCTHHLVTSPWATSLQSTSFRSYNRYGRRRRKLRAGYVDASKQFSDLPKRAACG